VVVVPRVRAGGGKTPVTGPPHHTAIPDIGRRRT